MEVGLSPISYRRSSLFQSVSTRAECHASFKAGDAVPCQQSLDIAVACYCVPKRSLDDVATLIVGPNDKDRNCMVPPSLTIEGATADRAGPLRWRAAAPDFAAQCNAISRSCSKQCSAGRAFINAMWQHLGEKSQAEATGSAELRNSAVALKVNGADKRQ